MTHPMLARLASCLVLAGLLGTLLLTIQAGDQQAKRDAVAALELRHRFAEVMFARP